MGFDYVGGGGVCDVMGVCGDCCWVFCFLVWFCVGGWIFGVF